MTRIMEKLVSPCISICQISDETGFCLGCYRTRGEIASWQRLSFTEQKEMIEMLHQRRPGTLRSSKRRRQNK